MRDQRRHRVLGDPWPMLVLRDVIFGNRRHFRELLQGSEEGIAPYPQQRAQAARRGGPAHPEEATRGPVYALTEAGIHTLPVMVAMGNWGLAHRDGIRELRVRADLLRDGGPKLIERFMDELREAGLGIPLSPTPTGPGRASSCRARTKPRRPATLISSAGT
jgi:DNA-binding HxlR family transcriptional regulator